MITSMWWYVWWRRRNLLYFHYLLYVLTVVRTQTILTVCFISAVLWHGFSIFSSTFGLFVLSFHKLSLFWILGSLCEGRECSEVVRIGRALQRHKLSESKCDRRNCVCVPFKKQPYSLNACRHAVQSSSHWYKMLISQTSEITQFLWFRKSTGEEPGQVVQVAGKKNLSNFCSVFVQMRALLITILLLDSLCSFYFRWDNNTEKSLMKHIL